MKESTIVCPLLGQKECTYRDEIQSKPGQIFIGYPFKKEDLWQNLKRLESNLKRRKPQIKINFIRAKEPRGEGLIQLCKICQQMQCSDLCLFDLRNENLNVAIEFGVAFGKGLQSILLFKKNDHKSNTIPTDLSGIVSVEFRHYSTLLKELKKIFEDKFGNLPSPSPVSTDLRKQRIMNFSTMKKVSTEFEGSVFDESIWKISSGNPTMIRQNDGLWIEWQGATAYGGSGSLTLHSQLPDSFEFSVQLMGSKFGRGWDPGVYLYAGAGIDLVMGVNLMPPVPPWGIKEPFVLVRTPHVSIETGRLNFNIFDRIQLDPGKIISCKVRVDQRIAKVELGNNLPVEVPLPSKPTQLVVGAFRWTRDIPEKQGDNAQYLIKKFYFRAL
jgi:hypothetical protein